MAYAYHTTLHFGIANAGLGTGITAKYYSNAATPVLLATKLDGVLEEIGLGDYQFSDSAVPDLARNVRFTRTSGGAYIASASIEPPTVATLVEATVSVAPLVATVTYGSFSTTTGSNLPLSIGQHEAQAWTFAIIDDADAAVDLSAKTLRFVVHDGDDVVFQVDAGEITVGGAGNNAVTVPTDSTDHATADRYDYKLWNLTDEKILVSGAYKINRAPRGV